MHVPISHMTPDLCVVEYNVITLSDLGPDLGASPGGPGPRPPTIEGPPTKLLIFYFLLINHDDFFIDALLQFASVTMY